MKKYYFLLLFFTTVIQAQIVSIPDANFKAKLLESLPTNYIAKNLAGNYFQIDANGDNAIQVSEAQNVAELDISFANISNATGIEAFSNVTSLNCSSNQLTNLSLENLTALQFLGCSSNQLTSLNTNALVNLFGLACDDNQIAQLDISTSTQITTLVCSNNLLTSLDVSALTNLDMLFCSDCSLTSLNFGTLSDISRLYLMGNQLTSLDLSHLDNLQVLDCSENLLTSLSINNITNYIDLLASFNQLTTVNFGSNTRLAICNLTNNSITNLNFGPGTTVSSLGLGNNLIDYLDLSNVSLDFNSDIEVSGNPMTGLNLKNGFYDQIELVSSIINQLTTWQYICLDENESENVVQSFPNIVVNSYCSFTPGGSYNTITGTVKFDDANDGCDASDIVLPYIKVNINDGFVNGSSFLNNAGNYNFYTQNGNFSITPAIENPSWFVFSPVEAVIPFSNNNNNVITQDFCITGNGFHPDIEVVIAPIYAAQPGFDAQYEITFKNKGNYTYTEGLIGFQYDDAILDFVSSTQTPLTESVGQLYWSYTNLRPFESRSVTVTLNVNGPTETPAVNIDDLLSFTASSYPSEVDETPQDNAFVYEQIVVGSFDPNNKICLEGDVISVEMIGNYLHYNINFENTGTAPAQKIVVKDIIDTTKFDINTLQVLSTSHPALTKITENKVEFMFDNINLAPAAHGNVVFKIKTKSELAIGITVSNKADIYFDYNFPIETNTATSTFQLLNTEAFETDDSISVFPNPAKNQISVNANNTIKSMQLFDVQGRIINTSLVNDTKTNLDVSMYSNGVYFLQVTTDKGIKTQKIIKE